MYIGRAQQIRLPAHPWWVDIEAGELELGLQDLRGGGGSLLCLASRALHSLSSPLFRVLQSRQ